MLFHTLYWIALVLAAAPLAYYFLSLYCVIEYFGKLRKLPPLKVSFTPPISILKPVRGVDQEAYQNFASYCWLDYPEYEIIFAVADEHDEVVPIIERLQAEFPECSIRLIKGVARIGTNSKVNSLCRLAQEAKYELLVMSDSDVRVERDYLKVVAGPFADSQVGAVTAFYRCITKGGVAASLSALGMCLDSTPGALVARRLEKKMQFAFGWTMATSKQRLAEVGGWEAMANYHSDDFELGNRIAKLGYRVELMRKPVEMVFPEERFRPFLRHELRWSIGLKNVRPIAYWGLLLTHGLPLALLAASIAAASGWIGIAAAHVLAYLALRLAMAWVTGVWGLGDYGVRKRLWLVPVRDAVSFLVWVAGFFFDRITWRGLAYRVKNGQLFPVANASARLVSPAREVSATVVSPENIS
jgi:ceramide glucosyltransferase